MADRKLDGEAVFGLIILAVLALIVLYVLYSIGSFLAQNLVPVAIAVAVLLIIAVFVARFRS